MNSFQKQKKTSLLFGSCFMRAVVQEVGGSSLLWQLWLFKSRKDRRLWNKDVSLSLQIGSGCWTVNRGFWFDSNENHSVLKRNTQSMHGNVGGEMLLARRLQWRGGVVPVTMWLQLVTMVAAPPLLLGKARCWNWEHTNVVVVVVVVFWDKLKTSKL